jgi:hypothetical protein
MIKELIAIHKVKCKYCGVVFDRDKIPYKQISDRRYAHLTCAMAAENERSQAEKDKEDLEQYIMQLLGEEFISARVRKQINSYVEQYNYTYSGMKKALVYFYEVKKNDVSKANGGIGIIPYVYRDAYNYYYSLWLAKQKNEDKDITSFKPRVVEVRIAPPQLKPRKRNLFKFFEEDK